MRLNLTLRRVALLLLISAGAVLVHGYHPAVEDGELYLPGVKKALNPALYPFNGQFFLSHAHMTAFPNLIAASVRLTHIPFDYAVFLWHFALFKPNGLVWALFLCTPLVPLLDRLIPAQKFEWRKPPELRVVG